MTDELAKAREIAAGLHLNPVIRPYILRGDCDGHDLVRAALTALTAARDESPREADGWQSMDSAPKDGTRVLLACECDQSGMHWVTLGYYDKWLTRWYCDDEGTVPATHWRPLPPPPSTGDGEVG